MRRAERLYALVDLLRGSRRPLSAARLSEEFEVSKRTIELASSPSSLRGSDLRRLRGVARVFDPAGTLTAAAESLGAGVAGGARRAWFAGELAVWCGGASGAGQGPRDQPRGSARASR